MPRIRPVLFGVIVASAITYKCRDDLLRDTQSISHRLNEAKSRLDQAASRSYLEAKRARSSYMDNVPILADSQRYVSKELVPSVKHSWNEQIKDAAHTISTTDYSAQAKSLWNKIIESIK